MSPLPIRELSLLVSLTSQPIYLVGGSVRDMLLGKKEINDIDLLMPLNSETVAREFAKDISGSFFFLDEERKITRVIKHAEKRTLQFDFTNFEGADLAIDLVRRDFTINAMALDLREFLKDQSLNRIVDLFHGKDDLQQKCIRMVKPEVFDEDPLRLLRAVRFSATLGFTIEANTGSEIKAKSRRIAEPASERVRDELFLILAERNVETQLLLLDSLGLLSQLLPELESLRSFKPGFATHDVLTHSIKTAGYIESVLDDLWKISPEHASKVLDHLEETPEQLVSRKAALRFACLLHDIAKPETMTEADGHIRFHGHDNIGAEKASAVCKRLRLSRETEGLVSKTIKQHMRLFNLSMPGGPSKNAMYRYCRDMGDALPESLLLAQADARATYEIMPPERFTDTEKPMAVVLDYYYTKFLKVEEEPLVTGQDLIELGFVPGPRFKEILDAVKERQAGGALKNREKALEFIKGQK